MIYTCNELFGHLKRNRYFSRKFWIYANEMLQNILIHCFRLRTYFYIFDMLFSIRLVGWRRETFCCNLFKVQPQNDQTSVKFEVLQRITT